MSLEFIVIEGNIGAGKTSIAKALTAKLGGILVLEEFANNAQLSDYLLEGLNGYDMELNFVQARAAQLQRAFTEGPGTYIADYHPDKSLVFSQVNLAGAERDVHNRIHASLMHSIPSPDLLVYLDVPTDRLLANIHERGRSMERRIDALYLRKVAEHYESLLVKQVGPTLRIDLSSASSDYTTKAVESILETLRNKPIKGLSEIAI